MMPIEIKDKVVKESFLLASLLLFFFFSFGYITVKILVRLKIMFAKYGMEEYYQQLKNQVLIILS